MSEPEVRSSRPIYQGRIFTVTVDRVRLPHGPEIDLEVVRHPGSVVMLCVPAPGQIILVRQYRYCAGRELWEVPAGSLGLGEDPETGARRECHEEVGLVPRTIRHLTTLYPTPGFCTERLTLFLARDLSPASVQVPDDEDLELTWVTPAGALKAVDAGEIADAKSIAGILWLARRLETSA